IESKAALSVKKAEQSVKESKVSLIRPISSLGRALENTHDSFGAKAAEDDNGPSAITPQSRHRSPSASKVTSHGKVSPVKDSQGKFGEGFIGNQKNTRPGLKPKGSLGAYPVAKTVSASKAVKIDSLLDAKSFLPPGMTEEEIGLEAAYRLLKAKMAVMQEEMDKVVKNQSLKDNAVTVLEDKLKYFDDERTRISKNLQTLQGQIEKSKKSNEDLKKRNDSLESENLSLRKELDGLKKSQKDSESDGNTKEIRLNRALEEVEKYKQMMAKAAADSKDKMEAMKKTNEKLFNDYKKIQKQKSELLTIFKKQNQLIDVLKRQKLHLEAATLLGFSEEEFVRALNCRPGAGVDV
ncbi:Golgin sub A member 2, partial [Blyttiomyces sp. JEL0837]